MLPIITVVHGNGESGLWMTDTSERNYEKECGKPQEIKIKEEILYEKNL